MIDKYTKNALLFLGAESVCIAVIYLLLKAPASIPGGLLALTFGTTAIGVYLVNLVFITRLAALVRTPPKHTRRRPINNRPALRLAIGTAIFPLIVLVLYYANR